VAKSLEGQRYVRLEVLAEAHGVSTRTMRRYLNALDGAGWPVPQWRHFERTEATR
jgi:predicted DNA-binding transcriptional regulator YafY